MKNKIAVGAVIFGIIIFTFFQILKFFPSINSVYNPTLLSIQLTVFCGVLAIIMFAVYSYSWLTYIMGFIAWLGIVMSLSRLFYLPYQNHIGSNFYIGSNLIRIIHYIIAIILTLLTFYILKKLKVNMTKKEEGPAVIDTRRQKANIPE